MNKKKVLGLAAVLVAGAGIVGVGAQQFCAGESCLLSNIGVAFASEKHASDDGCAAKKSSAALASSDADGRYMCADKDKKSAALASAKAKNADDASCASKKSAAYASSDGCASKKSSAALASSDHCASKKSSAALAGADGCASSNKAAYADAKTANMCSALAACSVKGDLAGAKGADLDRYMEEKKLDGKKIENAKLPLFEAFDLKGQPVSSKSLKGQPTVLVMMAPHCGHSLQSLPVLEETHKAFAAKNVRVVGLMVGSKETAKNWFAGKNPGYEVWTTENREIAESLNSYLVPTYVLVDAKGHITKKLVGFKDSEEVESGVSGLVSLASAR